MELGFIGAKLGLPFVEPLTFLAVRFAIVTVLMLAVARWFRALAAQCAQWLHIAVSGLLVHGVYLGGVFTAIGHGLPSGITALVVGLQPLLTALAAGLLLGERVRPAQWCGLAWVCGCGAGGGAKLPPCPARRCWPCCCPPGGAGGHHLRHAVKSAFARRLTCARAR